LIALVQVVKGGNDLIIGVIGVTGITVFAVYFIINLCIFIFDPSLRKKTSEYHNGSNEIEFSSPFVIL